MSQPGPDPAGPTRPVVERPPITGDAEIDQALAEVSDLDHRPLVEHHDRLARAHEVLHGALDRADAEPDDHEIQA